MKYVFGTMVLCLFLFVLFDFIHKSTKYFSIYNPDFFLIFKFYFYQIPLQLVQILPIAALLASVITMVVLCRSNEVTAMRAAGLGPISIVMPLAFGGALLSGLSFALGEYVVPLTSQKMHFVQDIQIEGQPIGESTRELQWSRRGDVMFHYRDYNTAEGVITRLKILWLDQQSFYLKKSLLAERVLFDPAQGTWTGEGVKEVSFRGGELTSVKFSEYQEILLPFESGGFKVERRVPEEMSLGEISRTISTYEGSGVDIQSYKIAWHVKLAYPFAAFLVSFLGLQFAFQGERTVEAVRNILLAFSIGVSYWFVLSAGKALGNRGDLDPFIAGWLANFTILAIVGYQLFRVRRV